MTNNQNAWFVKPEGFAHPVNIRKSVYANGQVRFHYYARCHRWLPLAADKAVAAIAAAAVA